MKWAIPGVAARAIALLAGVPAEIQERGGSSPIGYAPAPGA